MSIIKKIHGTGPSNPVRLENRPDRRAQNPSGKAYLPEGGFTFDEYLEAQLKDRNLSSCFKKAGQPGAAVLKKSYASVAEPPFPLSLNDIIPELHIPFHACNAP